MEINGGNDQIVNWMSEIEMCANTMWKIKRNIFTVK